MDNNNFEHQFKQNLQASTVQPTSPVSQPSKLPLVIIIALSAVLLVESIALTITLTNYFSIINEEPVEQPPLAVEIPGSDGYFLYDQNDELVAMNVTCASNNGAYFVFDSDKNYKEYDTSNTLASSGTYSIANSFIVTLSGDNNRKLYHDGSNLAEGDTVYSCTVNSTDK